MRMLRTHCLLVALASLLSSCHHKPLEAVAASRIDKIMQARSAAGDFNGTVLVSRPINKWH